MSTIKRDNFGLYNNQMDWNFFSDIYILNQAERVDRWQLCKRELAKVGIERYNQFLSIPADPPMKSFCISQHEMIKTFVREGGSTLLALEDDVIFGHIGRLEAAIEQLPEDWDVFYLGCNLRGERPIRYSNDLCRIRIAWMSHSIAYSRKGADFVAQEYDPEKGQMFDDWLSIHLAALNSFVIAPMIAGQRPGHSDLWGAQTDYTSTIEQGNLLL